MYEERKVGVEVTDEKKVETLDDIDDIDLKEENAQEDEYFAEDDDDFDDSIYEEWLEEQDEGVALEKEEDEEGDLKKKEDLSNRRSCYREKTENSDAYWDVEGSLDDDYDISDFDSFDKFGDYEEKGSDKYDEGYEAAKKDIREKFEGEALKAFIGAVIFSIVFILVERLFSGLFGDE